MAFLRMRKPYLIMFGLSLILGASLIVVHFTRLCTLAKVNVNNPAYADYTAVLQNAVNQKLFTIPLAEIARKLIAKDKIKYIDLDYRLPNEIDVIINDTRPIALILESGSGKLYCLDQNGQVLPHYDRTMLNCPVITGISQIPVYKRVNGGHTRVIINELASIRKDYLELYLDISGIDVSGKDYIMFTMDGLPFTVKTYAGSLYESVKKLNLFLSDYDVDLSDVKILDMRSDAFIVAAEEI